MPSYNQILQDISKWDSATHQTRVDIAKEVAKKLGPDFMYVGFQTHEAGGKKHEMMSVEHQPTLMVFQLIPGGTFVLGTTDAEQQICDQNGWNGDISETPTQQLTVEPFLMANSIITEHAMKVFKGETDNQWKFGQLHPADAISRKESREWCRKFGMRLPLEPEWEYACRAGTQTVFFWGNHPDPRYCWMKSNADGPNGEYVTHSYMEHIKNTNAFGLVDMLGSMSEWVEDDRYDYDDHNFDGPYDTQDSRSDGILRGGCFMYDWKLNRCATRISCSDYGDTGISFRPAMDMPTLEGSAQSQTESSQTKQTTPETPKTDKKWWKVW